MKNLWTARTRALAFVLPGCGLAATLLAGACSTPPPNSRVASQSAPVPPASADLRPAPPAAAPTVAQAQPAAATGDPSAQRDAIEDARYATPDTSQRWVQATAQEHDDRMGKLREHESAEAIEWRKQADALPAHQTADGLVLSTGELLFAFDESTLDESDNSHLGKLARFLMRYPNHKVRIQGHTDNVGTEQYNLGLSERRADAVKAYLVAQGVDAGRLDTEGQGMSEPLAGNDTAAGRQQNRRVEVIIGERLASAQ